MSQKSLAIAIGCSVFTALACSVGRVGGEPEQLGVLCGGAAGPSSRGEIGWLRAEGTDVTPRFRELLARLEGGEDVLPPGAHNYVWLLVPGLFSNLYPDYMKGNVEALRDAGVPFREVDLTPEESVAAGAETLRDLILVEAAGERQVVILGHSKGGVDAAAALSLYPEIRRSVRCLVAMQAPYAGSPIATDLMHCPTVGGWAGFVVALFGNSPEAVGELSYETRRAFIAEHPYPKTIPTLSVATSRVDWRSIVSMTGYYIRNRYGVDSDGLVVPIDAVLPGSRVVHLDDMDHAELVLSGVPGFINYSSADVTRVLMAMALEQ